MCAELKNKNFKPPMQRVRNLARKKEAAPACAPRSPSPRRLEVNNNVLFLLSFHDARIAELVGVKHTFRRHNMVLHGTPTTGFHYECDTPLAFQYNLRFYTNLKRIEILSSRKVYMKSFNNMRIDAVTLGSVRCIDTEGAEGIRIGVLALKNLTIGLQTFVSLVKTTHPLGLVLEDVKCPDTHHSGLWRVFKALTSLEIVSLDVFSSFIDLELFRGVVNRLEIKHFSYMNEGPVSLLKTRTPYSSTCFVDRLHPLVSRQDLERIESLHIGSQDGVGCFSYPMPLLKCIKIDNVTIDDSLIKTLGPVRKVSLDGCAFKTVSFYDFIRWVSKTLRYISFRKTEIPLDGFFFMKKALSRCQVVVSGVKSFYIEEGPG